MKLNLCVLAVVAVVLIHNASTEKDEGWREKWKGKLDLLKKKLEERQIEAKNLLKKMKRSSQFDKLVGKNTMRVDKEGGKLIIQRKGQIFEMRVKEIVERDVNGTVVATVPLAGSTFEVKRDKNDSSYGADSVLIEIMGTLSNNANVSMKLYMFREAANITGEDDNDYEVLEGATKTNLEIEWPTDAKHLDVVFTAKCGFNGKLGKRAKKALTARAKKGKNLPSNARSPLTMSVCSNARMIYSPRFKLDDQTWEEMPNEFPKSEDLSPDGESIMVLRFKGKKIFYDPISETGDDIGDGVTDDNTSTGLAKIPNTFLTFSMTLVLFITKLVL